MITRSINLRKPRRERTAQGSFVFLFGATGTATTIQELIEFSFTSTGTAIAPFAAAEGGIELSFTSTGTAIIPFADAEGTASMSLTSSINSQVQPSEITTALWLDASDAGTLYNATSGGSLVAADGAVARWEDKSGNARHAIQATSGNRPIRKVTTQNGRDVVRFDGVNDILSLATGLDLLQNISQSYVFAVRRYNVSPSTYQPIIHCTISGASQARLVLGAGITSNKMLAGGRNEDGGSLIAATGSLNVNTVFGLQRGDYGYVSRLCELYFDGVKDAENTSFGSGTPTPNTASKEISIGGLSQEFFLNGDIAEIVVVVGALSPQFRDGIQLYLQQKWATPALS